MTTLSGDGRQRRWQAHNQQRRQDVLDAAILVIDEASPTAEIHVQQIADRAGLNRSVVYRYFADRAELDVAVQQEICTRVSAAVVPAITLDGTPSEIVRRIVSAYVLWAAEHPALIRFAEQDVAGAAQRPLEMTVELIAAQLERLIESVAEALGGQLAAADRAAVEPLVFGLIGGSMSAVRRWTARPLLEPDADHFIDLISQACWAQIDTLARTRGIVIPDLPVEDLFSSLTSGSDT